VVTCLDQKKKKWLRVLPFSPTEYRWYFQSST